MTWSDKLTNHTAQRNNIMSPITTSITSITRKSVNMVAELSNDTAPSWSLDITDRLEGNPEAIKVLHAIALKTPSRFGADVVVVWMQWSGVPMLAGGPAADRMPGRLRRESLDRLGNPTFRLGLQSQEQSQEQHIRLDEDQLTTDTTDLKMTEDALAEETVAFKDTTQDCLAIQAKVADFEATNNSLSEELEACAKAKAVISDRDNRSVLSSRGCLARKFTKSEHSIELVQLASHVVFAMHAETSNDDDPFAKVKGLISDMIARLEEKVSADNSQCYFICLYSGTQDGWIEDHRIIVDIEMIAVKSYKSPVHSRWNDWQSIVIETEYGYAWMDKADENSQCLETYDTMRKTTESERDAKDHIMEQVNKYVRNRRRRYCRILILLSKFG